MAKLRKDFKPLVERNREFYRYIQKHNSIDSENAEHQRLLSLALRSRTVFAYLFDEDYYYGVNPVVLGLLEGRGKLRFFNSINLLQSNLKQKHNRLYLIALDTQNLCRLFVQFLEDEIEKEAFVIHNLYDAKSSEKKLNTLQLHRDGFVDDVKRHIFILNYQDAELLREKGDFTSKAFFEKFSDNSAAGKIESELFDTQELYQMVEAYEKNHHTLP